MQSAGGLQAHRNPGDQPVTQDRRYVSVAAFARKLDVSRQYVARLLHAGVLPGRKAGRRIGVLPAFVRDIDAAIESGEFVDVEVFAVAWRAKRLTISPPVPVLAEAVA